MSQPGSSQKHKKRKHAVADGVPSEPSAKRSKTGKHKREKLHKDKDIDGRVTEKRKDKGKAREDDSQFKTISATLAISIPPVFANNLRAGAEEMLDSMIMRYIPALQGVVLAHDNLQFLESTATVKADCPFANCRIRFDATVWSPQIGMKLIGKVNLSSPDHISLLAHRIFNVSILRHHIPTDNWEFEHGPAENDPEFGAGAQNDVPAENDASENGEEHPQESGHWVHKITGTKLGDLEGYLEFTVIGLTVANQMLSLVGSIQADPFSPGHVPEGSQSTTQQTQDIEADGTDGVAAEEPSGSEDEDAFDSLHRAANDATAREAARKEKEAQEAKERKRKRKEARANATDKKRKKGA